jgi:hypothetical protein
MQIINIIPQERKYVVFLFKNMHKCKWFYIWPVINNYTVDYINQIFLYQPSISIKLCWVDDPVLK